MRHPGLAARLGGALLVLTACTPSTVLPVPGPEASLGPPMSHPSKVPTGPGSAAAELAHLCVPAKTTGGTKPPGEGPIPPAISEVEHQVEQARGLTYDHPVQVEQISAATMSSRVTKSFKGQYPAAMYDRRTQAWRTIGVIPPGADLRRALLAFGSGQVVGYYDPATGALVVIADPDPTLTLSERYVLAHELTHAVDDQHFGLSRLDPLIKRCQDESFAAALGAVEGNAQYFARQVILAHPSTDIGDTGGGGLPPDVPPFVSQLQLWSYTAGERFITSIEADGGTKAVNHVLTDLPVSTEQIIHPASYPSDTPVPLDIPELGPTLGSGWTDLDVMQVGEEWLQLMLHLRLPAAQADPAAAGWGGGIYRAWSDGSHTAVVLRTTWDTAQDADQFAGAMLAWLDAGPQGFSQVVPTAHGGVDVLFASDAATLATLRSASR
ncbi:MAG: hypothetical protein QOF65_2948 [Thermoleophilaceae bacterium]|nr:hypothetical protein [Thermoleophilaceae bacterium]